MSSPKLKGLPCVLLEAGKSVRTPTPKGLMIFRGKPLLEYQVETLLTLGLNPIVVLGFHAASYSEVLREVGEITIVENPTPELGPFSSLQIGLWALSPKDRGCFILPLDTPVPTETTWEKLVTIQEAVAIPISGVKRGHPVFLRAPFISKLIGLDATASDSRLDWQIRMSDSYKEVPVTDSLIFANLNTGADFLTLH